MAVIFYAYCWKILKSYDLNIAYGKSCTMNQSSSAEGKMEVLLCILVFLLFFQKSYKSLSPIYFITKNDSTIHLNDAAN